MGAANAKVTEKSIKLIDQAMCVLRFMFFYRIPENRGKASFLHSLYNFPGDDAVLRPSPEIAKIYFFTVGGQ
jgi:hypothetical protein